MMNLYQQQQLQQQQQQLQQQASAEGLVGDHQQQQQMGLLHGQTNGLDPTGMFGAAQLNQQQRNSLGLGGVGQLNSSISSQQMGSNNMGFGSPQQVPQQQQQAAPPSDVGAPVAPNAGSDAVLKSEPNEESVANSEVPPPSDHPKDGLENDTGADKLAGAEELDQPENKKIKTEEAPLELKETSNSESIIEGATNDDSATSNAPSEAADDTKGVPDPDTALV